MLPTKYIKTNWLDHIIDPTQFETDESGNIVIDETTGLPKYLVIQEGTRFTANRANNIEEGIFNAYAWIKNLVDENQKLQIEIEMLGRVKENNGTFFDTFEVEGLKQLKLITDSAISQNALNIGATTVKVSDTPFKVNEYVTIYDDEKQETVKITAVGINELTIEPTVNVYKKGAIVTKTNSIRDSISKRLKFGQWGTFSLTIKEVI